MISIITAFDRNRLIGNKNSLPWHLPEDLNYFKQMTQGNTVIMGRKTFESMGKPLPNRTNIILTSNPTYKIDGCKVYNSITDLLNDHQNEDLWVIGGSSIYKQFLPFANFMHVTYIDHEFEGDTYFPEVDRNEWKLVNLTNGEENEQNPYRHCFKVYKRK